MRNTHPDNRGGMGVLAILVIIATLASEARAQSGPGGTGLTTPPIVGGPPPVGGQRGYIEAWVDPCRGIDLSGAVDVPDRPFRTLQAAITAVVAAGAGPALRGLVHANPGIYGPTNVGGNGEMLPVVMADGVHVQGVGAKRCIIRGGGDRKLAGVFYPTLLGDACECGSRAPREVLVFFSSTGVGGFSEFIDGFTFQGGDVQVYFDAEGDLLGRVSNCVFDMLDHQSTAVGIPGPDFGILMVSVYCPSVPYFDNNVTILNNTFIQGWSPQVGEEITSDPDAVAICDVNDPLCELSEERRDPDPSLRGVGAPNIQNNLIRYCDTPHTPFLGIDLGDTSAFVGGVATPSNAFDPTLPGIIPGALNRTGTFCSSPLAALPVPAVNPIPATGGSDPAFVGEMLSSAYGNPTTLSRDWRILPDSILVDAGVAPINGTITAVNGTVYTEPGLIPEQSFDFDGEVYGNSRIVGDAPDIGFDEFELMINAGGYGNDTRTYGSPCPLDCPGTPGIRGRALIFPSSGTYSLFHTWTIMSNQGYPGPLSPMGYWWAFSSQFGTAVPPAFTPGLGFVWIQIPPLVTPLPFIIPGAPIANAPVTSIQQYSPPCDPFSSHSFGIAGESASLLNFDLSSCFYLNEQVVFSPTPSTAVLSNLQVSYLGQGTPPAQLPWP